MTPWRKLQGLASLLHYKAAETSWGSLMGPLLLLLLTFRSYGMASAKLLEPTIARPGPTSRNATTAYPRLQSQAALLLLQDEMERLPGLCFAQSVFKTNDSEVFCCALTSPVSCRTY